MIYIPLDESCYVHANENKESKFNNFVCVQIIHEVQSRKLRRHSIIGLITKNNNQNDI